MTCQLQHSTPLTMTIGDPAFKRALAQPYVVNHSYDIPYVAGYSKDGGTIYLDRELPLGFHRRGKLIETDPIITYHAHYEKSILLAYNASTASLYDEAHLLARGEELALLEREHPGATRDYLYFLSEQVDRTLARTIATTLPPPPDLDLLPYHGRVLYFLEAAMARC